MFHSPKEGGAKHLDCNWLVVAVMFYLHMPQWTTETLQLKGFNHSMGSGQTSLVM